MTVKELMERLEKCNLEDAVEIYIHCNHEFVKEIGLELGFDYLLLDPVVVEDNGWDGLITIEGGKIVGC